MAVAAAAVQVSSTREEEVFEIRIDGKLVCAKRRGKPGVFLHMETFAQVRGPPLCVHPISLCSLTRLVAPLRLLGK